MCSIEYYDRVKKSFGICGDNPPFFKIKNFPLSLLVNSEPTQTIFIWVQMYIITEWGRVLALVATILPFFPFSYSTFPVKPPSEMTGKHIIGTKTKTWTTTTTATTTTPPLVARCSVVLRWSPIVLLVHGLNIIIIYYHNQKCSARMWQPVSLEKSSLTPNPYHQPQIFLLCISHFTFHLLIFKSHQPPFLTHFSNSITHTDVERATSPR